MISSCPSGVTVVAGSAPRALSLLTDHVDGVLCTRVLGHLEPLELRSLCAWAAVSLTLENAWLVVLGSGFRGMLQGLDPDQVERVRQDYPDELERRGATEVDATSLVGAGSWPHGS